MPQPVKADYTTESGKPLVVKVTDTTGRTHEFYASLTVNEIVETGKKNADGEPEFGFLFNIAVQRKKGMP